MWTGKGHFGNLLDYCLRTVLQMVQAMPIREVVLVVSYSYEGAEEGVERIDFQSITQPWICWLTLPLGDSFFRNKLAKIY